MIISSEWNVGSSVLTNTPASSLTSEQASKLYTKVGLLSASDIGYSTNADNQTKALNDADLYTNSWLKGSSYYTLTPVTDNTTSVIGNNATTLTSLEVATATGIKPVVSLIPNVYIKGGNGTSKNPYELAIVEEEEHYSDVKVVGYITYDVNGQTVSSPKMQPIFADGSTVINRELANVGDAKFKGWATSADGEVVYKKGDTIPSTGDITLYAVWQLPEKLVDKITSTLTLTSASADIDGTRYVTGDNNTPNYLWYSGKLWRIVSINGDGTIKLVTQGNMTTIAWDSTKTNTDYSNSQVHSWLNNEFLPTLANADTVLANSIWDYTEYSSSSPSKVQSVNYVENEKVGLLTVYDWYMVSQGSSSNFLANGYTYLTMSPQTISSYVWFVYRTGVLDYGYPNDLKYGVRPSVNLRSEITILGGSGTKTDPYTISGDKETGSPTEALNNRISGEYINFNDVLYRIVGIEEINGQTLTKITMADYGVNQNTLSTSVLWGKDKTEINFSPTYGIGLYLEEWYQADSTSETYATTYIDDTYKAMIATANDGILWYTGPDDNSGVFSDYLLSKTGTSVSATIGLGRYGELFTSQFGDGATIDSAHIWTITKENSDYLINVAAGGNISRSSPGYGSGVRPFFYLKSNVKIVSGTGMPHDPYEITQ